MEREPTAALFYGYLGWHNNPVDYIEVANEMVKQSPEDGTHQDAQFPDSPIPDAN